MAEELAINPSELEGAIELFASVATEPEAAYSTLTATMPPEGVGKGLSVDILRVISKEECAQLTSELANLYSWTMQVMQGIHSGFIEADEAAANALGNS
jgi:hypothetical protein